MIPIKWYEYEYKWGGCTRRPFHCDHLLIYCAFPIFSILFVVPHLPWSTVSCITKSYYCRLVPLNVYLSDEVLVQLSLHTHRTCEAVLAWVLSHTMGFCMPLVPPCLTLAIVLPPGTSRWLGLAQVKPAYLRGCPSFHRFARTASSLQWYARTAGFLGGDLDG
jgi:hypothetical protein